MSDFDLTKLEEEIKRKRSSNPQTTFNRDKFLGDLLTSLETGRVNESVAKVSTVAQRSDNIHKDEYGNLVNKNTEPVEETINRQKNVAPPIQQRPVQAGFTDIQLDPYGNVIPPNQQPQRAINEVDNRENQMYRDFSRASSQLASKYNNGMINEYSAGMAQPSQNTAQPVYTGNLNEQIEKTVVGIIGDSMTQIANSALKNAMFESYKTQVIKEAIAENKELIKEIVKEYLLELQKRNQKKS